QRPPRRDHGHRRDGRHEEAERQRLVGAPDVDRVRQDRQVQQPGGAPRGGRRDRCRPGKDAAQRPWTDSRRRHTITRVSGTRPSSRSTALGSSGVAVPSPAGGGEPWSPPMPPLPMPPLPTPEPEPDWPLPDWPLPPEPDWPLPDWPLPPEPDWSPPPPEPAWSPP